MAAAGSLLFFLSVLVHEMSHTLVARRQGVPVKQITLFLFGGASETEEPVPDPGTEVRMVAAGPLSTAALTVGLSLLATSGEVLGLPVQVTGVLAYLAQLNLLLLVFNLLPALPLDGGRLVHAWLWRRHGNRARATLGAARGGQVLGFALVALGILAVSAGAAAGLWSVFMGGFLLLAVQQETQAARAELAFADLTVEDVMTRSPVTLTPDMTVADLAEVLLHVPSHPVYPVVEQQRLVGMLVLRTAGAVPLERRGDFRVRDLMLSGPSAPRVQPGQPVHDVARRLSTAPGRAAVIVGDDQLAGLISISDLVRIARDQRGRAA
jgi:Zn-dependent protease/CBS domain-containing protein